MIINEIIKLLNNIIYFLNSKEIKNQKKFEHYQKINSIVKDFYYLIPVIWSNKENKYKIDTQCIEKTSKNCKLLKKIQINLSILSNEAKYLFDTEIEKFEKDFYLICYKCKFLLDENETANYSDSIEDDLNSIIEKIRIREELYEKFLKSDALKFKEFIKNTKNDIIFYDKYK